jgi:predicted glycosyltransferase
MLKYAPERHDIEGALFPEAGRQLASTHVKPQFNAECVRQGAAVLNGPYIPAYTVRCMKKIASAASHFQ